MTDTIYAPSSAVGGAIAVLRVSGPEAKCAAALFDRDFTAKPGRLLRARLMENGEAVDDCMAVYFASPRSYTGEDMVEINCHGGVMSVKKALELLGSLGFRAAEPGEFTRRAFENGKMDLSQAEAVMDVVTAGAQRSLKAAMRQLQGGVRSEVRAVEETLLDALSGIDAAIDYPDEAEADTLERLPEELSGAKQRLIELIENGRRGRVLRDGVHAVILGRPNVGKSSLLNRLLGHERAIVTALPGTTRDTIDERVEIDGVPVRFIDTAGVRNAADEAERIGVERAYREADAADILLLMLDGSEPLSNEDRALLARTENATRLIVVNKCDLPQALALDGGNVVRISAKDGTGVAELKEAILERTAPGSAEETLITNERHLAALEAAHSALVAIDAESPELDCVATDIRDALKALGSITGSDVDETVIERIFSRFCVGK